MCYRLNEVSLPMMNELIEKIPEASLLFGPDIEAFLNEIVQEATKYSALQQLQASTCYLFNDAAKDEHDARKLWFAAKMGEHRKKFEVYMDFSKWRG